MADQAGIMFDGQMPTPLFLARWRAKGGRFQPQATATYLEDDNTANAALRSLWRASFPKRRPLPFTPIVDQDGRFTNDMLSGWI